MRVRRFIWLWCASLLVVALSGVSGLGGAASALLVAGPPPGGSNPPEQSREEPTTITAASALLGAASTAAPAAMAASTSSPSTVGSSVAPVRAPGMPTTVKGPLPTMPAPDPEGLLPCKVADAGYTDQLSVALATAGLSGASPFFVDNCRPFTGDVVGVYARGFNPGTAVRVSFGDGTFSGTDPADCATFPKGEVSQEHRYTTPGRRLLEATSWFPCAPNGPTTVYRVWIDVAAGQVPQVPGAAPCRGLGPVKPGEPARQGRAQLDVQRPWGVSRAVLARCSVAVGQQSDVLLLWYEAVAIVDWGDGTARQQIGGKGQQGARSVHAHATRGLHTLRVWVLGPDGQPQPPLAFSVLVT